VEQHRSDRVAEQRGGLRFLAFSQVVLLVTIGLQ
jgi:hypothetical protein